MNPSKLCTITVQFPNRKKDYYFNIHMRNDSLQVGDTIYLPTYNSIVKITGFFPQVYPYAAIDNQGQVVHLSETQDCCTEPIKMISWFPISENTPKELYKSISLVDAQEMYKQGGKAKEIALKNYPEEELNPLKPLTPLQLNKSAVLDKLQQIANRSNGLWTKREGIKGYFLNYNNRHWDILWHQRVTYPGIVYFKDWENARKALLMLTTIERDFLRA